ncbi:uncharacterized protein LOC107869321 [Capsicum annuum]|uniref:uncharacterized protein LOC107869321 n=1 Tax=Capsicum annuum TaxID=4072 RepID=UPI001FB0ADDB|nr:uncharacterized protein LOC107869321 [Capsicum annuum]
MVTFSQLNEDVAQIRNFTGITDELEQTKGIVDLITQINTLTGELVQLRYRYDESVEEFLSSRDALVSLLQDQGKVMEDLQMKLMVLRYDESAGHPKIDTWDKLKKEMRDQFLPSNATWIARNKLKRLRQTGTIRDYINVFTSLMLDIENMSDEDKLHNFISGMQEWSQIKLRWQTVKDLPSAITAADSLVNFHSTHSDSDILSSSKSNKKTEKKWEGKKDGRNDKGDKGKAPTNAGNAKNNGKDGNFKGCWTCGGPHLSKSCPNRERVNALRQGRSLFCNTTAWQSCTHCTTSVTKHTMRSLNN